MSTYPNAAVLAAPPFDRLVPACAGYRTMPVSEAFNWSYTLEDVDRGKWHLIVFRSVRRADADTGLLTDADDLAFAEAMSSGGLLRYFKGSVDRENRCLSLCVWQSRKHARVATALPLHVAAAELSRHFYVAYDVERYTLRKRRGHLEPEITWASGLRRPAGPVPPLTATGGQEGHDRTALH